MQKFDTNLLAAANAAGHQVIEVAPMLTGGNGQRAGVLCAANEQSFNNSFMSEPLTAYVQGMPDQDGIIEALDYIAPQVPAARRFEFRKFGNTQMFLSETDDVRGIGASFKAVEFKGELETGRTINKGLAFVGDLDVLGEIPNWEQLYANWLRVRCFRNDLRRGVTALLALDAGTTAKWLTTPVTDPDADLMDLVEAMGDTTGLNANALTMGATAWSYRVKNLRSTDKAGGFAGSMWTPAQLGEWLGLEHGVRKSNERFATGSGNKTRLLGAYAVAFHRSSSPVMEDPSTLKRFVTGLPQIYRRELSAKLVELSVSHYSNIVSTGGAKRFNVQ
jgi:hypothetical protein